MRGYPKAGLLLLAAYAAMGIESLGHYMRASIWHHTLAMNASILIEVAPRQRCSATCVAVLALGHVPLRCGHELPESTHEQSTAGTARR